MKRLLAATCSLVLGCGFNAPAGPPDASSGADAAPNTPPGARCANYQLDFEGHKYRLIETAMTWASAKATCELDGGYLLKFETQDEDTATAFAISEQQEIWIGLSDLDQNGAYVWTDGSAVTYARWDNPPPPAGNCIVKNTLVTNGRWYPRGCTQAKPSVCECNP